MRRQSLVALAAAALALAAGVVLGVSSHRSHVNAVDDRLAAQARIEASTLSAYFAKARAITLLTAQALDQLAHVDDDETVELVAS